MSVAFYGDYDTTETVNIPFNTFSSNDPSASVTITNLVAGDIEIHKDGGTTQRSSDSGVTVTIDFDSVTGNHMAHIDLSDNTDADFYAAGSRYQIRIEGTTVDAGTINAWIGAFSIGCTLRSTTAGRTLDIQATGEVDANLTMIGGVAQSATDLKDFADTGYDPTVHKVQGVVLTDTCTTLTGHTAQTADHAAGIADIPTVAEFEARTIASADYVVVGDTIAGATLVDTVTTLTGHTAQTADHTAGIADIPTVAEFEARTIASADYVVTTDTIAGVTTATNLTNAPTSGDLTATMKTSVNTEVVDVLKTDTISEMGQAAPPASPTFEQVLNYLYRILRNKTETTATELAVYDDAGTTKLFKSVLSDDATTFTKAEHGSGA